MAKRAATMQRDPSDSVTDRVRATVARALAAHVPAGATVLVALSGGRDSVALLDAAAAGASAHGWTLAAGHVHHGLSANADAWTAACARWCAERGVAFHARRVDVPRGPQRSVEADARRLRYAALVDIALRADARCVALAHHRDDQAETVLLQLLRGAGPHGLAAMPPARADPRGVTWLRPLLDLARADIDAYVARHALRYVDDESNAGDAHLRNALRHRVLPLLVELAPAATTTLHRAALHQAEAARLADDLAAEDARDARVAYAVAAGGSARDAPRAVPGAADLALCAGDLAALDRAALNALPAHRARNLLRWFLRGAGLVAPSTARLDAMLEQLRHARTDAMVRVTHDGVELGMHRGRIVLHPPAPPAFDFAWQGEPEVVLPHGIVRFAPDVGAGADRGRLAEAPVRIRSRAGGERLQLAANRPRRALKAILHDAALPPWQRRALPLVYCGDALAAVAGFAVDTAFAAAAAAPGVRISWHPAPR